MRSLASNVVANQISATAPQLRGDLIYALSTYLDACNHEWVRHGSGMSPDEWKEHRDRLSHFLRALDALSPPDYRAALETAATNLARARRDVIDHPSSSRRAPGSWGPGADETTPGFRNTPAE